MECIGTQRPLCETVASNRFCGERDTLRGRKYKSIGEERGGDGAL